LLILNLNYKWKKSCLKEFMSDKQNITTKGKKITGNRKPIRQRKRAKKFKADHRKVWLAVALVLLLALGYGVQQCSTMTARYHGDKAVWVKIPKGATSADVIDSLQHKLGKDFGLRVARYWDKDTAKSRGAYLVEPGMMAYEVAHRLNKGRQTPVKLTFNNLRTLDQLDETLSGRMDWTDGEFLAAFSDAADSLGIRKAMFIGHMIPDTYEVYWTDTPTKVLGKILDNYDKFWNVDRKAQAEQLGLTPDQVTIVASIAEEETAKADERGKVARLYINRYKRGMRLQADPTVKFAVGDFTIQRIGGAMLDNPSPYNTYRYPGLPPGPIRIPDKSTLDAVLSAPEHNYLYMCARADFSGYHDFSSDFAEHKQNAAKFQKALNTKGISLQK
jgi:UPF0755 protein